MRRGFETIFDTASARRRHRRTPLPLPRGEVGEEDCLRLCETPSSSREQVSARTISRDCIWLTLLSTLGC